MVHKLRDDQIESPFTEDIGQDHSYFDTLRRKLRWQLMLAYTTPLLLLSAYFHYQYYATLKTGTESHIRSVAENKRNTVSLFLQERVANTRGAFNFVNMPPSAEEINQALSELRRESPTFVDLGLFDPKGTLVSYAGPYPELRGRNYGGEEWYRRLMHNTQGYWISDVFLGFRQRPHFIVAVRKTVDDRDWTLRASVDPEKFAEFVGRFIQLEDAEAFIVNREGVLQTTRRGPAFRQGSGGPGRAGASGPGNNGGALATGRAQYSDDPTPRTPRIEGGTAPRGPPGSAKHPATRHQTLPGVPPPSLDTEVRELAEGGRDYLTAFAWLPETNWALVVRVPSAIAFGPARRARLVMAAILLGTLVLVVFLVLHRTRRVVDRLEQTVRSKEDLRHQLFNAAKLASVGEMGAGVAHEINNPLAIIYEEAGMMRDILDPEFGQTPDMDDFRERLDTIKEAAIRGRTITRKLLAFARQDDAELEQHAVNELLDKVLALKANEFRVDNIEVVRDFAKGLPPVLVNRNQFDQVLLNLLNNANDAMEGSGTVTVTTRHEERHVCIDVADTGCGMSPRQMEKVFFPFFTTKGVGKGTGLGLSISYGIIKSFGGRIEVRSEVDRGSTFTIMLPVRHRNPAAPERAA